jgi:hypothetical protein
MSREPSVNLRDREYSSIEDAYFQAWGKVGGAGRLRRTFSLFAEFWGMLEFQIRKAHPGISDREARRQTAKRMYFSDSAAQRLLDHWGGHAMERVDIQETLERIMAILGELGLRYHVTGGVAASFYGDPRFTQDLDLVIQLSAHRPETRALLNRLSSGYLIHEQAAREAIQSNGLFQAIDEASLVKIDFHVGEKIPGELERSKRREVVPGVMAPLVSKEDAILSKLLWIRLGSNKARHDVTMMLKRPEELDRAVLHERAATLGLGDLLTEFEEGSGSHSEP